MRASSVTVLLLVAIGGLGCTGLAGLDDLAFAAGSGGGAGVGGAASSGGGSGGGGATGAAGGAAAGGAGGSQWLAAEDWSPAMGASYLFESPPPDLGRDASGALHLGSVGAPQHETVDAPQGAGCAMLPQATDGFRLSDPAFDTPGGTGFTVGAWVRIDDPSFAGDADVIHKRDTNVGGLKLYAKRGTRSVSCLVQGAPTSTAEAESLGGVWTAGQWWHAMCRYDADGETIELHFGGEPTQSTATFGIDSVGDPFDLSDTSSPDPVLGCVDEVFFVRRVLDDASLRRIHACGIDGGHCRCDAAAPTTYLDCGRLRGSCDKLPACDAASPLFLD
jgi:hypothetical protein